MLLLLDDEEYIPEPIAPEVLYQRLNYTLEVAPRQDYNFELNARNDFNLTVNPKVEFVFEMV